MQNGGCSDEIAEVSQQDVESSIKQLHNEISMQEKQVEVCISQLDALKNAIYFYNQDKDQYTIEFEKLTKDLNQVQNEIDDVMQQRQDILASCQEKTDLIKENQHSIADTDDAIENKKSEYEKLHDVFRLEERNIRLSTEILKKSNKRVEKATNKLNDKLQQVAESQDQVNDFRERYQESHDKCERMKEELSGVLKTNEVLIQQNDELREHRHELDDIRADMVDAMATMRDQILFMNTDINSTDLAIRFKGIEIARVAHRLQDLDSKRVNEKAETRKVESEREIVQRHMLETKKDQHNCRSQGDRIDLESARFANNTDQVISNIHQIQDEVFQMNLKLDEALIVLSQRQESIRHQDSITESFRNERDMLKRQIQNTNNDSQHIREQMESEEMMINRFKDDIRNKDDDTLKIHISSQTIKQTIEEMLASKAILERKLNELEITNRELNNQIELKYHIITQANYEIRTNTTANQLILKQTKNIAEEISQKYREQAVIKDKEKLNVSLIMKGSHHYNKLMMTIQEREQEAAYLIEQTKELMLKLRQQKTLKDEIIRVTKIVNKSAAQVRALEDEMETPMNVHRWTLLKATNPELYHLIELKLMMIEDINSRCLLMRKLKIRKSDFATKMAKLNHQMQVSVGGRYDEEFHTLNDLYKQKTKQLKQFEQQLYQKIPEIDDQREQVSSARSVYREEKIELQNVRQKITEVRMSTMPEKVHPPRNAPSKRGRFVGGGFGLGDGCISTNLNPVKKVERRPLTARANAVLVPTQSSSRRKKRQNWGPQQQKNDTRPRSARVQKDLD